MSLLKIPEELKAMPNWVGWKLEKKKNSRGVENWTKPPYDLKSNGTLRHASTDDPSTWATFELADAECGFGFESKLNLDGAGIVLPSGRGGVDFDGVVVDEKAESYVLEILKHLGNPYTETSPSGNGLRAFFNAPILPTPIEGELKCKFEGKKTDKYAAEIYFGGHTKRYLTVTGEVFTGDSFSGDGIPTPQDIDLAYFLISQFGNEKFKDLWMGDLSKHHGDPSRADLALVSMLARLLHNDVQRIEKYFGASILGQRSKWIDRKDYRDRTIKIALSGRESKKEPAASASPAEIITHTADQVKPRKLKWLWMDRVSANKITLYAGNPDNGKSLAAIDLVARVTARMNFPDCVNTLPPSEVLMLLGEDDEDDTAVPRLMSAGADLTKVHFPEGVKRPTVNDGSEVRLDIDLPALEAYLDKHPAIRLIVIDPISSYLGDVNMIAEQSVRSVLTPLRLMAMRRNVAVLFVMHLNKKSELDAISRVGGAMAFIGVARSAWLFIRDESTEEGEVKDSFTMCRMKSNLTASKGGGISYHIQAHQIPIEGEPEPEWAPYIVWGEKINKSADDSLGRTASKREGPGRPIGTDNDLQVAMRWLEQTLEGGPRWNRELKEEAKETANIKLRTLERAKERLEIEAYQEDKKWLWRLPQTEAQDAPTGTTVDVVGMVF
jgi:putative DNA primase/helicase